MNNKGWIKVVISFVLGIVLLAVVTAIILRGVARPATDLTSCPTEERCMESCTIGFIADSNRLCKDKDKKCCLTMEEKLGEIPLPGKKKDETASGTGTGTGEPSGTGTETIGSSTDTKIIIKNSEDPNLPEWKSLSTLNANSGTTYKFDIWLTGAKQICTINVREITEKDISGRIIKTQAITPTWFKGAVTRAVCNSTNRKTVEITFPSPLTDAEIGKEFKLDIMAFTDTTVKDFTTSATIYIKPQGTEIAGNEPASPTTPTNPNEIIEIKLGGNVQGGTIIRNAQSPSDTFEIKTSSEAVSCTVRLVNTRTSYDISNGNCLQGTFDYESCSTKRNVKITYGTVPPLSSVCAYQSLAPDMRLNVYAYNAKQEVISTKSIQISMPETCNNQPLLFNTYASVTTIVPIQSGITFTKHCQANTNDYGDDTYLYLKMTDNGCNRMCRITLVDIVTSQQGLLAYQHVTGLTNQLVPCDGHRVNFEFPQQCTASRKTLKLIVDSESSFGSSNPRRDEFTIVVNP